MSSKYKFLESDAILFVTPTIVELVDVFTREQYREILLNSLRFCQENQGLKIHAWVLMSNHLHMIYSCKEGFLPRMVLKNIKSFTVLKIIDAIINNKQESRKKYMLNVFEEYGKANKSNYKFQFWIHENHPIILDNEKIYNQRMDYIHLNPVRAGLVFEPQDWKYSSGVDYYTTNEKGLLKIEKL